MVEDTKRTTKEEKYKKKVIADKIKKEKKTQRQVEIRKKNNENTKQGNKSRMTRAWEVSGRGGN